jgi:hypothetical protein
MSSSRRVVLGSTLLLVVTAGCSRREAQRSGVPALSDDPAFQPVVAKKEPPKTDFDSVLADFRVKALKYDFNDATAGTDALKRVRDTIPRDHPRHAEVFRTLVEVGDNTKDVVGKPSYYVAAAGYAAKEEVPELIDLVNREAANDAMFSEAVKRLKELKDPRCVPAALKWWTSRRADAYERKAFELVKAIGPRAEKPVQPYARPNPPHKGLDELSTRQGAIRILAEIGTEDSLPLLKSLLTDEVPAHRKAAQEAIAAIQKRAK